MANEILTLKTAVKLGKLICPPAYESAEVVRSAYS